MVTSDKLELIFEYIFEGGLIFDSNEALVHTGSICDVIVHGSDTPKRMELLFKDDFSWGFVSEDDKNDCVKINEVESFYKVETDDDVNEISYDDIEDINSIIVEKEDNIQENRKVLFPMDLIPKYGNRMSIQEFMKNYLYVIYTVKNDSIYIYDADDKDVLYGDIPINNRPVIQLLGNCIRDSADNGEFSDDIVVPLAFDIGIDVEVMRSLSTKQLRELVLSEIINRMSSKEGWLSLKDNYDKIIALYYACHPEELSL